MYKTILLVVEGTSSDQAMVEYIKPLARLLQSRVILFHGENWQTHGRGKETFYPGATDAVEYLKKMRKEFQAAGVSVEMVLAYGEPVIEIEKQVQHRACDLVVMNTQERKSVLEIFFGAIFEHVQNAISVPVLLFKLR